MAVKQLSVFVENKFGRLSAIIDTLAKESIDISALSLADTTDFGILRIIVNKPQEAIVALKEIGVTVMCKEVLAIAIDDTPGGLSKALNLLANKGIVIEYMYAFVGKTQGKAMTVIRTDKPDEATDILSNGGIKILEEKDIIEL